MENGKPNVVDRPVTWETLIQELKRGNVSWAGSREGVPYVSSCKDRSQQNCEQCVAKQWCFASLAKK